MGTRQLNLQFTSHALWGAFLCIAFLVTACGGTEQSTTIPQFAVAPMHAPPTADETQVLKGPRSNYTLTRISVGFVVTDTVGGEGSITIKGKKILQFDDVRVNLGMRDFASMVTAQTLDSIIDLYVVFLARVPDADGLA